MNILVSNSESLIAISYFPSGRYVYWLEFEFWYGHPVDKTQSQ
jgi:hypothetical protein